MNVKKKDYLGCNESLKNRFYTIFNRVSLILSFYEMK